MNSRRPGSSLRFLVIPCDCGFVIRGQIEVELLSNARNHLDEAHPELRWMSDDELLAKAQEQFAPY